MRPTNFLALFIFSFILYLYAWLPTGCANIIPPSGGPRDSLPPQLVSATPKDSTLNFSADRIIFTFDEYVDLQDVQNNLLFTPIFEVNPEVSVRARTVTVRFRDTLEPNTTYTFNFGSAIRDINESNPLQNFTYTFSTGPALDTLTISGRVILAESGKTDSNLVVILHKDFTDSAIINKRPTYATKLDANGNFIFRNLPADSFTIYALGDAGVARRFQRNQLFAFSNQPVAAGQSESVVLYAYREQPVTTTARNTGLPTALTNANDRRLRFFASSGNHDLQKNYVLKFQTPLQKFDSTKIALSIDSSFTPVNFASRLDTSRTEVSITSQWREGTNYNLILDRDFAEDTAGRKLLKTDTLQFTTKRRSDYAELRIRIRNLDLSANPVLQLVENNTVVFSAPVKGGTFSSNMFNPGDYELRILYDRNNNGIWDAGDFFNERRQPELVKPIDRKITVKAGLENEFEVSVQ